MIRGFFKLSLPISLLIFSIPAAAQKREPPKSALERRGLFHANIRGRFLTPEGAPVAGVHVQLPAGRPRSLPLMDVVTGDDGQFAFRDVNSEFVPTILWSPPEKWLGGALVFAGESGGNVNVGD